MGSTTQLAQLLARASRRDSVIQGRITSVDTSSGRAQVNVAGATVEATMTDQAAASATTGIGAVLLPVGQTLLMVGTLGGTVSAPNLVPNGSFSNPGDGLAPTGWQIAQDGSASLVWQANKTAGPAGGWCGQITVLSMGSNQSLSVVDSPNFTVDTGATYTLSFDAMCDSTVTNCIVWPSLQCYSSTDTWWGVNLSNGVLSPNVGATWGSPYSTDLTIPSPMNRAHVNLGVFCDTTSTGSIYVANVALRRIS